MMSRLLSNAEDQQRSLRRVCLADEPKSSEQGLPSLHEHNLKASHDQNGDGLAYQAPVRWLSQNLGVWRSPKIVVHCPQPASSLLYEPETPRSLLNKVCFPRDSGHCLSPSTMLISP